MIRIAYLGKQEMLRGQAVRLFNLHLPDGRVPTLGVAPGQDLKQRVTEVLQRFMGEKAV